ncbi:unnamed protein product [Chrysoparadoxa australica]
MLQYVNRRLPRVLRARRHLHVCVVGSGPAGFYTTKYLLKEHSLAKHGPLSVNIVESLPTPYGLVRSGVAPDHQEVKAVVNDFAAVAEDPRVQFLGNVEVGKDVNLDELMECYHMVVLAYGAAGDRALNIPGAESNGVISARAFVGWYNGHPSARVLTRPISEALSSHDTVVVVGVGNVALDCARILVKSQGHELQGTDISDEALAVMKESGVKRVVVLGRRGHVQAAFTIKELRELLNLGCVVHPEELKLGKTEASLKELAQLRPKKRMDALLSKHTGGPDDDSIQQASVSSELRFLASPIEILAQDGHVVGVKVERNTLEGEPFTQKAIGTGNMEVIDCGLVIASVGYKGHPVDGLPFHETKGIALNEHGRVIGKPGLYCAGWLKRGPSGIIGTNIVDAKGTVSSIVEDVESGAMDSLDLPKDGMKGLLHKLEYKKKTDVVDWQGAKRIETEEARLGGLAGKVKLKLSKVEELLQAAASGNEPTAQ